MVAHHFNRAHHRRFQQQIYRPRLAIIDDP